MSSKPSKPVLLIEDDKDILEAEREILEAEGFRVRWAENGAEGLKVLAEEKQPCIIVLDLAMPVMDGVEFLQRLRAQSGDTHRVIVASADRSLTEKVAPFQVAGVLRKPFELDAFVQIVREACAES